MTLCAIIVLYNPEYEILKKSLSVFSKECDAVILYKNSSLSSELELLISAYNNTIIIGNGSNVGIATALNRGIREASKKKFTYLMTLDQDSYFDAGTILKYREKILQHDNSEIGIFGINPLQSNRTVFGSDQNFIVVNDTITSGSVFKTSNFDITGYFDDQLFIDAVDYDYCYRALKYYGLKTIVFPDLLMHHTVGYVEKTKFGFSINNYSAFRTYFIVRNQLAIWRRYPDLFQNSYKVVLMKDHIFIRVVKIILAERDKINKLKAIFVGIMHFIKKKQGYFNILEKN